jgi:16S rRNA processing protein RimM
VEFLPEGPKAIRNDLYLAGYTLVDERHGAIGQVKTIDDRTLNILLTVDFKGNELFIPLALATSIQPTTKTIYLSLPDGFLEI